MSYTSARNEANLMVATCPAPNKSLERTFDSGAACARLSTSNLPR